jgi:hypothetical protein
MGHPERSALIKKIEAARKSRVICYCTSDRPLAGAPPGQVSEDAMRPLHEHLRQIGKTQKIDLFLYTRGGAVDVPWRIVSALRQYAKEWHCLVPFRAHSAGTMIAIGADSIVMGAQAELGPIDPSLNFTKGAGVQDRVSVEDVMAFVSFVREKAGSKDQAVTTNAVLRLLDRVDAVLLGNIYRTHAHIRDVAKRILQSRPDKVTAAAEKRIISTLAERVYAHGHAISFPEAKKIGLPVKQAEAPLDTLMWDLLREYESEMNMLTPLDPATSTQKNDVHVEEVVMCALESHDTYWNSSGEIEIRAKRQLPANFNPQIALNLQLPQGFDPATLTQDAQQILQQLVNDALQQVKTAGVKQLLDALTKQSPAQGYELSVRKMRWRKVN